MAGRLEIQREHKRREYRVRLHRIGSVLVSDRAMRIKVLEQAGAAVDDVSGYVRHSDNGITEFGARRPARTPVRSALAGTRRATSDLRLRTQGESPETALRRYVEAMDVRHVLTGVSVAGPERGIPPETRDPIHLVVREAPRTGVFVHRGRPGAGTSVRVLVRPAGNRDVCPV